MGIGTLSCSLHYKYNGLSRLLNKRVFLAPSIAALEAMLKKTLKSDCY